MHACAHAHTETNPRASPAIHIERAALAGRPLPLIMDDGSQKEKKESVPGEKKKDHDRRGSNSGSGTDERYNHQPLRLAIGRLCY